MQIVPLSLNWLMRIERNLVHLGQLLTSVKYSGSVSLKQESDTHSPILMRAHIAVNAQVYNKLGRGRSVLIHTS